VIEREGGRNARRFCAQNRGTVRFYGRKYSVILGRSESITLVDKQRYWACAGEVVFGDLGIFHAASTGGTLNSKE
jgi:hypothetical protein